VGGSAGKGLRYGDEGRERIHSGGDGPTTVEERLSGAMQSSDEGMLHLLLRRRDGPIFGAGSRRTIGSLGRTPQLIALLEDSSTARVRHQWPIAGKREYSESERCVFLLGI
jgi:hypothetical protein